MRSELEECGPVLLIVMYETGTWRLRPGEAFTFGRAPTSSAVLPAEDSGLSRHAGSFSFNHDCWWVHNTSRSSLLYLTGDKGFRVDLPPGMRSPLQQWHIKVRLHGFLGDYTLRLRLPDLDDVDDEPAGGADSTATADGSAAAGGTGPDGAPGFAGEAGPDDGAGTAGAPAARPARRRARAESVVTTTHNRLPLTDGDRLVLAARFEEYLTWRHVGAPVPRSAAETARRIGWDSHTVTKRCENIRNRYTRMGIPGLRGPRALEELIQLLMSTGTLDADDLQRLPPPPAPG